MPGKHLDLDLDSNLGGENPSDVYIASQKATKTYVDGEINTVNGKIDSIQIVDELAELQDVSLSEPSDGQALTYDSATQKWKNGTIDTTTNWGNIGGTLSNQTDLNSALTGKADVSHTHTMANITDLAIPSKVSQLQNDSGYLTNASLSEFAKLEDLPTNVSELTNDSGYITDAALPTALSDLTDDLGDNPTHTHSQYAKSSELSTVATTGQYTSLIGTPSNVSEFINDVGYLTSEDISAVFVYKGTKATKSQLPTTGNKKGDVWTVSADGSEYVWDGSAWQYLGQILDLSGYVPTSRTINGQALTSDITLTYTNVGAASTSHTHNYVPTSRKVNNKALTSDVTLSASDVGALPSDTAIPSDTSDLTNGAGFITSSAIPTNVSAFNNDAGYLTEHQDISGKQDKNTAVTHTASTSVGDSKTPVYVASDGKATALGYTIEKSVPSDAKFTDTTYTATAGITLSGTQIKHSNSITSGTAGTTSNTSGSTLAVPYVTYDAQGHITAKGTHTHTVTGFLTEHQDISGKANISEMADVAFSGAYSDLSGTPTIPSTYSDVGAASAGHTHTYTDVGAASASHGHSNLVPTSRKVAGKALTSDITITYSDVSAASSAHTHTYGDVGAASASHTHSDLVPNTRKVAGKALTSDITLTYSDVSAASSGHTHTYGDVGAASSAHTHTYSDVGAASSGHTHSDLVPTSRKIAGKALTSDVTLSYSDVGAASSSHTHSNYVPTSRKVAGHALTADVTISSSDIGDLGTTISSAISGKANATETYTKSEIDGKLSGAMHFKGTKASEAALPTTGNTTGDMWNVTDTGANYAWDGTQWDKLSENIDLSGVVPNSRTVNGKTLSSDITLTYTDVSAASQSHTHTYSDVGAASASHTHSTYVPTSRTVNSKALTSNITLTYTDVNAASDAHTHTYTDVGAASSAHTHSDLVPNTRKIAGKALTSDITLTYSDVSAASSGHTHTYGDVGAASASHTHSGYVPTSRTINSKALTSNISLTYSDVGALSADTAIPSTYTDVGAASASHTHTYSDVGAASTNHTHSDLVPTSRKIAGKALTSDITLTYSDVSAASSGHTHSNYVPTSRTINSKALTSNITLTYSDVGALSADTAIPTTYSDVGAASSGHTHTYSDVGAASASHTHSGYQPTNTAVTHTANTSVGNSTTPVYIASDGKATALSYTIAKSVPSDAKFSDTTYTAGSGLSLSGTQFKHKNSVTSGTAGTTSATSGSTVAVPYVTYDSEGHVTAAGTHTHTISGFATDTHTHTYSDVGAASSGHTHSNYVPTSRTINSKALTSNITLSYSDVGALSAATAIPSTYTDVGAASASHTHSGYVPTSRKVAGKALTSDITLTYSDVSAASASHTHTYSDVGAASSGHTHSGYVPTSRKVAGKALTSDISLTYSDVSAASAGHTHTYSDVGAASDAHTHTYSDVGAASASHTHSGYQPTNTAVTHTASTSVGNSTTPVYIASDGKATALSYTIAKSVPSDAKFSDTVYTHPTTSGNKHIPSGGSTGQFLKWSADGTATWAADNNTTYSAGTGLSLSGTTFNHSNSVTSGTVGTSAATSGSTLSVPYVTYDAQGHVTATGVHTHTVTGFATSDTKNTAGSTDSSSKLFLIGATTQAANPQTYSHDTAFVDTSGQLNSANPSASTNSTVVATTKWVTDKAYLTSVPNIATNKVTALTGYAIATASAALSTSDSLNTALGKLEFKVNNAAAGGDVKISQLNGASITPTNPSASVTINTTTRKVTVKGQTWDEGDNAFTDAMLTAADGGATITSVPIETHSSVRCYKYNNIYYSRDTLAVVA